MKKITALIINSLFSLSLFAAVTPRFDLVVDTSEQSSSESLVFVQASSQNLGIQYTTNGTVAQNLTGATTVKFYYTPTNEAWLVTVTGTVENATNGQILFSFTPSNLNTNSGTSYFNWISDVTDGTNTMAYAYGRMVLQKNISAQNIPALTTNRSLVWTDYVYTGTLLYGPYLAGTNMYFENYGTNGQVRINASNAVASITGSTYINITTSGTDRTISAASTLATDAEVTAASNGLVNAYTAADTIVSNGVTVAFGSADTVVSNGVTSAFQSADHGKLNHTGGSATNLSATALTMSGNINGGGNEATNFVGGTDTGDLTTYNQVTNLIVTLSPPTALTPWTNTVSAAGYDLNNVNYLRVTNIDNCAGVITNWNRIQASRPASSVYDLDNMDILIRSAVPEIALYDTDSTTYNLHGMLNSGIWTLYTMVANYSSVSELYNLDIISNQVNMTLLAVDMKEHVITNAILDGGDITVGTVDEAYLDANVVLDNGNNTYGAATTQRLDVAIITNANIGGVSYPTSDGVSNAVLTTDGAGTASWSASTNLTLAAGVLFSADGVNQSFATNMSVGMRTSALVIDGALKAGNVTVSGNQTNSGTITVASAFSAGTASVFVVTNTSSIYGTNAVLLGTVGVGVIPTTKFHVSGNAYITGSVTNGTLFTRAQPCFFAMCSNSIVDVTGDGTVYTCAYTNEIIDIGGIYNPTTGTFTASNTGFYQISANVVVWDIGAGHDDGYAYILTRYGSIPLVEVEAGGADRRYCGSSSSVYLQSGDTVTVKMDIRSSTKTVDFNAPSYFSAYYLGQQ